MHRLVMFSVVSFLALGCGGDPEVLPLLDHDGTLRGTATPMAGELTVTNLDAAYLEVDEFQMPLQQGKATVDTDLAPGEPVWLFGASGVVLEDLVIGTVDDLAGTVAFPGQPTCPACPQQN